MADKRIGELAEAIEIKKDDLLVMEQDGIAKKLSGERLSNYVEKIAGAPITNITYSELKSARDNGTLTPGTKYRITDYVCTTAQEDTRAVSHQYDIIVTADNEHTLNENAKACLHDGDDYYSAEGHIANLEAWELKYTLDNDTTRFEWADTENGRGVVYYLKDDHGNECPYDFKQIQFKRYKITKCPVSSLVGKLTAGFALTIEMQDADNFGYDLGNPIWCYTFNTRADANATTSEDASILPAVDSAAPFVVNNVITSAPAADGHLQVLSDNVFEENDHYGIAYNFVSVESVQNTFIGNCVRNIIENQSMYNIFGNRAQDNDLDNCVYTFMGDFCSRNTLEAGSNNNYFDDGCVGNTLIGHCAFNEFGKSNYNNTIANSAYNRFGDNCFNNKLERGSNNYFEGKNTSNTLGSDCKDNFIRTGSKYIQFGNWCNNIKIGRYCCSVVLEDYCQWIDFDANKGSDSYTGFYHFFPYTRGTSSYKRLNFSGTRIDFKTVTTYVGKDSNDKIVTWVPADQSPYIESMLANRENSMTTSADRTTGSLVVADKNLYKLDANVSSGETLTPGTNCHVTNIDTELNKILNSSLRCDAPVDMTIAQKEQTMSNLFGGIPAAEFHNGIFRGKSLGNQVTDEQWEQIANGTFDDMYLGDYWTFSNGNIFEIVDFDYYYNSGKTGFKTHHIVVLPRIGLDLTGYVDEYISGEETNKTFYWNITDTSNGYLNSHIRNDIMTAADNLVTDIFGAEHLSKTDIYCPLSFRADINNVSWIPTRSDWVSKNGILHYCELPTQIQLFGGIIRGYNQGYDMNGALETGSEYRLFSYYKFRNMVALGRNNFWTRQPVDATNALSVNAEGMVADRRVNKPAGVRPRVVLIG